MRIFNKTTKNEGSRGIDSDELVELPDSHPFFQPLPDGYEVTYDLDGLPVISEMPPPPPPTYSIVTKLQAVKYWQAGGLWVGVKTMLATDEDLNDRWIAASQLEIGDPDVVALGAALEQQTGVTLQQMFNDASAL